MELTQNREKKPVWKCSGSKHCGSVYPRPIPRPDGSRLTRAGSTGPPVPGRASYLQKGHSASGYPPLASGGNIWWWLITGKTNKLGWSSFPCPFLKLYSPYPTLDSWEKTTIYLCFQSIHLCLKSPNFFKKYMRILSSCFASLMYNAYPEMYI